MRAQAKVGLRWHMGPCAGMAAGGMVLMLAGLGVACASLAPAPLAAIHAYVWPADEEVRLFLCRWPDGARVGVALPETGPAEARDAAAAALAAWKRVRLPIRLEEAPAGDAQIEVRFLLDAPRRDGGRAGSARNVADCRVGFGTSDVLDRSRVEVSLHSAPDARGHVHAHEPDEIAGAVLHELGHALGFQGHPRQGGDEPMVREAAALKRLGRRVLRAEPIDSPAVRALYARPAGFTMRRQRVSPWRTAPIDALRALAKAEGLEGPFTRSGDAWGRIFWRDGSGTELGVWLPNLKETYDDPTRILLVPDAAARARLEPSDVGDAARPGR